jgi:hypothetical protein
MTLQQELARTERHRLVHARSHGCKGRCVDGRYLEDCATIMHRLVDEDLERRPVVPSGTLGGVRQKIQEALARDELARQDPLLFALLAYEELEPGEVLLLDQFEEEDSPRALAWLRGVLEESGAEFEFDA